ncbi:MAG: hypothetical protein IJY10_05315 [Lachnospiraceae bacterium]|nr:hypothetical protein [Lachnospiraceae bacterium]
MNGLVFSCLAVFAYLYHVLIQTVIRKGKIREGNCALWIGQLMFAIFGLVITLSMYRFSLWPFVNLRNLVILFLLLIIATLLLLLAPSGLRILMKKPEMLEEDMIRAEYRFNDTLGIIRNLFLLLLFLCPIFFALEERFPNYFAFLSRFGEGELCSVFCLIAFSILLPITLRQAIFWIRNVTYVPGEAEMHLVRMEKARIYYKKRNIRI